MERNQWKLWPFCLIAVGAALLIIGRAAWDKINRGFDNTSLILFAIASVALLLPFALPRIKKIKVSETEVEFRELEQELPKVAPSGEPATSKNDKLKLETAQEWNIHRDEIKKRSREVFLAHCIKPSDRQGQKYDIYILLTRSKLLNLDDVDYAEFFFGRYWGNQVFRINNNGGKVGISTAAYGPFLCVCRVTFKDGYQAYIDRFIDFAMGIVFDKPET